MIVESSSLKAVPDESNGIKLAMPDYGEFPLTDWAHRQLADKTEIPRKNYEKMLKV